MMKLPRFATAWLVMLLSVAGSFWASSVAQEVWDLPGTQEPTAQDSTVLEPPAPEPIEPADTEGANSRAADQIRAALQDDLEPTPSGDPILDDVLQIIRRRGSVLDGSPLDPAAESAAGEDIRLPEDEPALSAFKLRTAEQLLKAARLLQQIEPGGDQARRELIEKLRRETVRLLTE